MINTTLKKIQRVAAPLALAAGLFLNGCGGPEVEATQAAAAEQLAAREAALAERERAFAERQAALAEQGREISGHLEALAEREQELDRRLAELGARSDTLATRQAALARREAAFEESQTKLAAERQALAESRTAVEREAARQAEAAQRQPPPEVYTEVALAPRTVFEVEFLSTVSSASSRVGDTFTTRLTRDVVASDGRLAVPAGTVLTGVVTEAVPVKRVGGQALLGLEFGQLHLPWGRTVELDASFYDAGRNEGRRDKKIIGGGAAAGAVLGAIIDSKEGRGALLGAILGAAAGTAAAANRPGDQVEIPGGTVLTLALDAPVTVAIPWKSRYSEAEIARAEGG